MEESSVAMKIDTSVGVSGTDIMDQELLNKVRTQMEFYFSVENLQNDSFLVAQMDGNRSVAISEVMKFNKLKALTTDENVVTKSLEGSQICIVENGRVRGTMKTTNRSTLILRDIPSDAPLEEVKEIFNFPGQDARPIISVRSDIGDTWFVHFETEEGAKETLAELKAQKISFRGNAVKGRVKSEAIARSFYPVQSPTTAGVSPIGMPIYAGVPSPYAYPSGMPPMQMPYGYAGEGMDPSRGNMGKGPSGDMKAPSPSNANNRKNNGGGSAQNKGNNQKGNKDGSQKMNGSPSNYNNNNSNNNNNKSDNGGRQKDGNKKDKKDSKGGNEPAFNNNLADFPALDGAVNTATQTNTTVGSNSYINQIVNIAKPHMSEADQAAASVATAAERFQSVAVSGPGKGGNVSNNDNVTSSLSNSVWGNKTAVAAVQTPPFKPPTEKAVTTKVNAAVQAVKPTNVVTNEMETPSAGAKTAPSPAASPPAPAANPGSAASSVSPSAAASDGNAAPSKPPVPGSWAGIVSSGPMPDPNTVVKMAPKKTAGSAPTSPGRPSSDEKKKDGKKDGGDKSDSPKKKKGTGDNNSSGGGAGASSSTRKKEEAEKEVIESPSSWGGRPTFANILREAESKQSSQQSTDEQKGDQSSWVKAASS